MFRVKLKEKMAFQNVLDELMDQTMEIHYLIWCISEGHIGHRDLYPRDVIDFTESVICKNDDGLWDIYWHDRVESNFCIGNVKERAREKGKRES